MELMVRMGKPLTAQKVMSEKARLTISMLGGVRRDLVLWTDRGGMGASVLQRSILQ